jgi:hypothetical protein
MAVVTKSVMKTKYKPSLGTIKVDAIFEKVGHRKVMLETLISRVFTTMRKPLRSIIFLAGFLPYIGNSCNYF